MTFSFHSLALVVLLGPRFALRRLPGEVMQGLAQGFDTAHSAMRFGVHSALKQHRRGSSQSLQTTCILVALAIIPDFCQQSWSQMLAFTRQALKELMVLMG